MPAENKKILLIAYYFPPLAMGGVGRPLALFKNLPKYGYDVTVITVKDILYYQYDNSLLESEDENEIIRTGSLDPSRLLYLARFRNLPLSLSKRGPVSRLYFPDSKRWWVRFACRAVENLLKHENFDAIITTSPPPSAHKVGLRLKKKFDISWIADFRDFWFSLPIEKVYGTGIQKNYALKLKDEIVKNADQIVTVNSNIKEYLGRGEVITNAADITVAHKWQENKNEDADILNIGMLGTINELCPITPLFEALKMLIDKNAGYRDKINILHVGNVDKDAIVREIKKFSLEPNVILKGYLPREKAFATLSAADILFISVASQEQYHILPGRIFDYIISCKKILGMVPSGSDAAKILDNYSHGVVIIDNDTKQLADEIELSYSMKESGDLLFKPDPQLIENYSVNRMAKDYTKVIDELI